MTISRIGPSIFLTKSRFDTALWMIFIKALANWFSVSANSHAQPQAVLRRNDVPCLYQGSRPVAFPTHSSEHWKGHCSPGSHLGEHQCFGRDRGLCWQWPFEIHRLQQRDIQKETNWWSRFQKHRGQYKKIPIGLYDHANIWSKVCSLWWKWSNQLASRLCMTQSYRGISLGMKILKEACLVTFEYKYHSGSPRWHFRQRREADEIQRSSRSCGRLLESRAVRWTLPRSVNYKSRTKYF